MILDGVRLMAVGMLTVFAFLTLLVGMMSATAAFFESFGHRFPEAPPDEPRSAGANREAEIALAVAVADAHRRSLPRG